ncbi:uncharacterized protein LOC142541332 [Primulina tabacum]|uniref:uncharacterized protein LOC142541332 n=1 Tax=Primulina tabacum TaxID=48773 RepID=UPI003F597236
MAAATPPPPPAKIDSSSPFYLGPQDRPGDFITPIRLKLDDFDDWSHAIRVALSSRRKFGFLNGTITDIVPPCTNDDWVTIQCMLVSWLMNTIDPEVRSMLSNYDNAKRLWDDLHERFSVVNGPRIHQLKGDINRCEQTKVMPVAVYFSKLNVLWDELDKHEPLISCKCGKCTCQDPLPTLNRAFQQIAQDERVRGITRITEEKPDAVGFAVRMEPRSKPRLDKTTKAALNCSQCHKSGHDITTCFDIHGTPDWYLEKYGSTLEGKGTLKGKPSASSTRNSTGHGRNGVRANTATPTIPHSTSPATLSHAPATQPFPSFSAEQWAAFSAAFGSLSPSSNRLQGKLGMADWIIDTGCSHHVTGNESCLLNIKAVSSCPVRLPDGQTLAATEEGAVQLTDTILLQNVLYVPNLQCNLISVSQLIDDIDCCVQFDSNSCAIQDQRSREMIGTGEKRDGL